MSEHTGSAMLDFIMRSVVGAMKYADIGKAAQDIFSKDYPTNIVKVEVKGAESAVRFLVHMT